MNGGVVPAPVHWTVMTWSCRGGGSDTVGNEVRWRHPKGRDQTLKLKQRARSQAARVHPARADRVRRRNRICSGKCQRARIKTAEGDQAGRDVAGANRILERPSDGGCQAHQAVGGRPGRQAVRIEHRIVARINSGERLHVDLLPDRDVIGAHAGQFRMTVYVDHGVRADRQREVVLE